MKVLPHSLRIGLEAREKSELSDRLVDGHAAAPHCTASDTSRSAKQLGFKWKINDVGDPDLGAQQFHRHRRARVLRHPDGGRVDDPVGTKRGRFQVGCRARTTRAEPFA